MDNGPDHRYGTRAGLAVPGGRGAKGLCKSAQACQARWPLAQRRCCHSQLWLTGVVGGAARRSEGGLDKSGNWSWGAVRVAAWLPLGAIVARDCVGCGFQIYQKFRGRKPTAAWQSSMSDGTLDAGATPRAEPGAQDAKTAKTPPVMYTV